MSTMEEEEETTDMISELPDALLHHILSFLDMVYVVQTCVLSKRWRYVWTSMPYLCFNYYIHEYDELFTVSNEKFRKLIGKVMSVRDRSNTSIHTIAIYEIDDDVCRVDGYGIAKWINIAVQHNIVVLNISVECWLSSHSLLSCKSLERLSLCLFREYWDLDVNLHDSVDLPLLKTLELRSVDFDCEGMNNLISRCPLLETLVISDCNLFDDNNLIVNGPKLKHLEIGELRHYGDPTNHNVTALTPNLTSFRCTYRQMMSDFSLVSKVSSFVDVEIDLLRCQFRKHDNDWNQLVAHNVRKCLAEFSKVKSLILKLHSWLLEGVFVPQAPGSYLHIPFYSLTSIKLRMSIVEEQTHVRSYILELCPNLETLILHIIEIHYNWKEIKFDSVNEECLQTKLPLECISHHLKCVEIWGVASRLENEFAFVKFLLQNASALETLSFRHNEIRDEVHKRPRVLNFMKQVETITRASRNVHISLLDWKYPCF